MFKMVDAYKGVVLASEDDCVQIGDKIAVPECNCGARHQCFGEDGVIFELMCLCNKKTGYIFRVTEIIRPSVSIISNQRSIAYKKQELYKLQKKIDVDTETQNKRIDNYIKNIKEFR